MTVSINAKGEVFLQNSEIKMDELVAKLKAVAEARGGFEARIFFRGDKELKYATVMRVLGRLTGAGYRRVQLVTEYEQNS